MLEVMVTCLHRYAALLKTPESEDGKILSYTVKPVLRGHLWDNKQTLISNLTIELQNNKFLKPISDLSKEVK
jgi:hypothetical protein